MDGATAPQFPELRVAVGPLVLRPLESEDIPAIATACADPVTQQWLPLPVPYTEALAREYVETQGWFRESGDGVRCAVALADGNALVGALSLMRTSWRSRVTEVGYWACPEHRGHGYITRATSALSRWALTEQGMERVELLAAPGNVASNRVALGAGFRLEGTLRNAGLTHAGRVDLNMYSLIAADDDPAGH